MLLHPSAAPAPAPASFGFPQLANVPVELYREIITQLSPGDDKPALRSLCLVSQTLRSEAERRLYSACRATKPRETAMLCDILAREPRLAAMVGELTVVTTDVPKVEVDDVGVRALVEGGEIAIPDTCTDADFLSSTGALVYWRTVARCLRSLPNLQSLTLAGDRALYLAWILAGTTFKLRKFCGYMAFDAFLSTFLYQQSSSLTDVELLTDGTWTGEPIIGLDQVSTMRVCLLDLDLAAHLIKGRPVTHLQVTTASLHDLEIAEIAREWRGSTGPVRAFTVDFGDDDVSPSTLRLIGEAFPQLRLLGIVPLDLEFMEDFCEGLACIPNLRTLLINNREPHTEIPPQAQFAVADAIRARHPTLRTVGYVHVRHDEGIKVTCYRYTPLPTYAHGPARGRWEFNAMGDVDEMWLAAGHGLDE